MSRPALVFPDGRPVTSGDVQRARLMATDFRFGPANESASRAGAFMARWYPGLRSADADWFSDRDLSVARARDQVRNDPVAASGLNRRVNSAVGFQWRMSSLINARALGITDEEARQLRTDIDVAFRHYAYGVTLQADAERKKTFGQLLRTSAAHLAGPDGESLAVLEWASDEATPFKTRMRVVDPDRLSNPQDAPDTMFLRRGVELNNAGVPIAFHIRESHPADIAGTALASMQWRRWERYASVHGRPLVRPQVLHAFDALRAGQTRGVSRFAAALKQFRALSKFTDATLEAVTINALLVGFIKSNAGVNAISESFTAEDLQGFYRGRDQFWNENGIDLNGARMPVLPPGDEVELATSARETAGFDAFCRAMLRLIAAALGITYEELSMDFSQTNYSSARAALAIAWTETMALRGLIAAQIATPFYMAWLEEALDNGAIRAPAAARDFYDAIDAWCECKWIGPARGYIDPTKEIDAAAARIEAGTSSLQDECDEQGKDWEEVAVQTAFERARFAELGIPYPGDDGALARVADLARTPDHNQALDAAPASR